MKPIELNVNCLIRSEFDLNQTYLNYCLLYEPDDVKNKYGAIAAAMGSYLNSKFHLIEYLFGNTSTRPTGD